MPWFVLQALYAETGCPAFETRFTVDDLEALRSLLPPEGDPDLDHIHFLSDRELKAIEAAFGTSFDAGGREIWLVPWQILRELPYLVHTGFELALMLEKRKPLAAFSGKPAWLDEYLAPFAPFVAEGRVIKRESAVSGGRGVYFALPGEEWRIDAYLDLMTSETPWNEALERRQGELLGYTEWERERWSEWRAKRRLK